MKNIFPWSMLAILFIGCDRSSNGSITDRLVGVWEMDRVTQPGGQFTATQHLKNDGTFEMRFTVSTASPGASTGVIQGRWRADAGQLYTVCTNFEPNVGAPQSREEIHTLTSVGASKFTIRSPEGDVRVFRRKD
jgi:hypothetical protein